VANRESRRGAGGKRERKLPPQIPALVTALLAAIDELDACEPPQDRSPLLRTASDRALRLRSALCERKPRPTRELIRASRPALIAAMCLPLSPTCSAPGCCDLQWTFHKQLHMMGVVLRTFGRVDPMAIEAVQEHRLAWLIRPPGRHLPLATAECIAREPALCRRFEAQLVQIATAGTWQAIESALRALGRIGPAASPVARKALCTALTHSRWQVRLAAVRGLRSIGGAEALLARVAERDPAPNVRHHSAKASSSLKSDPG
jgi:hypothetical protein